MGLSPVAYLAILVGIGLLLYALAWYATRNFRAPARVALRLLLLPLPVAPLMLGALLTTTKMEHAAVRDETLPQAGRAPSERAERRAMRRDDPERARSAEIERAREARREEEARQRREFRRQREESGARESPRTELERFRTEEAPPIATTPGTGARPPAAANGPATRSALPSEPLASAAPSPDWDVVPVFYGTDRAKSTEVPRVDYGSDRARRLQLGHALVTVPKSHQVPQVERPWVYTIPFTSIVIWREAEDPKKHFTMKEIREVSREEFVELVRKRLQESRNYKNHAVVFVHGFNTSFDFAVYRTAQIAYDLKFDGAPFLYSWPSKGQLGGQDYRYDRESATAAEPYLKEFLQIVAKETGATSLSIIAHSMGNQLLLPVLRDLRRSTPPGIEISQVILAAPDVDRDNFEFVAREIQGISRGVTLFAASNDRALMASRQHWGAPRAGDVPPEGPVIVPGVDTIDVTALHTELLSLNHAGYAEKTAILNDIQLLIQTGERPPERRVPILELVKTDRGTFWRYPGPR